MKRFLQNLFLTSCFVLTAFAALAQPTFSSATTTTTTNIRVTFTASANLTGIPGGFAGFTVTGATISAASIVGGAGNSKQVDLTVSALAPNFTCTSCVAVAAGTVTDGTPNGAIAAAGNNVTDGILPVITSVSIPNTPMKVGSVVTATIIVNSDADTYTLGASNIGGFSLGSLNKSNNTTYTAQFTVTNGGTDVAAGSNIPISVVLQDTGGNNSAAFTTAIAQGGDPIDANNPVITAVSIPNTAMKVGDVVTATITVTNDGGDTYTLPGGSTIGGFALGSLNRTNSTTYTATFTIANGGTDVAAGSNIPVNIVIQDGATNSSAAFTTAIAQGSDPIDANNPVITAVTIPNAAMKVGSLVTATITVTNDGGVTYSLPGGSTIGGFALGSLNRTNSTTYTATFTVTNGGTDVAAGSDIPVSVVLNDPAGNSSSAFTTAISQAGDPIDANNPVITAVSIPDVAMKVGDVVTATITVNSDPDTYTLPGGSTINGFALGSLAKTNNTTYTATFTITNGGTDRAAGATIPISVLLQDGATNSSNTFTTAISQANDPIDANNPSFTSVLPTPSTGFRKIGDQVQVNLTATGSEATLVAGATMTVNGVNVAGSFQNLGGGSYRVTYTVGSGDTDRASGTLPISLQFNDAAGNTGTVTAFTAANTLVIDANAPVISAVTIPNVTMKVGDVVTATITVANDGGVTYTLPGGSTIGGFALGGLARVNSTTYTATFTIANGGTDVPAGNDIPVSIVMNDPAGNASASFTTAISQGGDRIDANRPVITAVTIPNVSMKVGDVVTATITVTNDGGDVYTLPGGSTIGGFALGSLNRTNATTYTATFTITNGGTDVAAGSNIPITVTLQDTAGNNNSPAFTTAIVQANDRIDANNPAAFTVGTVVTTGGTVRAGYWNSTNSGVNVTVPIANDASLNNPGAVQLQGKISTDITWTNVGASSTIGAINTNKTMALTAVEFEGIPNFGESVTVQIRAIITDAAGNATTGTQSATTLFVDQVAPTISGAPRLFLDATDVGGGLTGTREVILFQTSEPMALIPSATPLTGTITAATNSSTVTGTGTLFTTELAVGMSLFKLEAGSPSGTYHRFMGIISAIGSNTSLTLGANSDQAVTTGAFTRGLVVPDFDNNGNTGFNVDENPHNNDAQMTSKRAHYFSTYTPPYASPSTFTNVVRITSKDAGSNWSSPSTEVSYTAAGASAFRDIAGNEFTMASTATTAGSTTPPALSPNTMTLFPRSTNPEKIVFNLDAQLGQQGQSDATGTITASTGSATVTGVGTDFVTEFAVGQQLWDGNGLHFLGMISAIGSATSMTLTANSLYDLNGASFASGPTNGTISTSTASSTVTGVGTLFTTDLVVGQDLYDVYGTTKIGTIQSITNNTTLVLTGNALVNLAAVPYTPSIVGFTSNPPVPFSAIYTGKGSTNKITLIAQSNGAFTGATTISYTQAAGNAVGANGVELLDITNHAVVTETVAPVITSVTIPNVSMKVGDVVVATITTADDDGDDVTLTSGAINGFALGGLVNVNGTTKTASFTVVEGGTDVLAASNVTFSTNLVLTDSSVPTASAPYSTAIVQANDRIDANSPKVLSINRQTTVNNGAPSFGTSSSTAVFRVTFSEDIAPGSISAADFAIPVKGIGTGTITASTASASVVGVGTSFTTQLIIGAQIWDRTGTVLIGTVNSITDNLNLTLTANAAANLAGTPYSSPNIASLTGATITNVAAVTGTSVYDVTVGTYTGLGVLGLDYVDNNDANAVLDIAGNSTITSLVNPDGDFAGQTYQIVLPQPSTHVTGLTVTAAALDNYSLKLDWTGTSTGATNYLIIARGLTDLDAAGAYPAVADKTPVPDDTDFTDGQGAINISSSVNTYTFTTLLSGKSYDFTIIPYALSPNNTSDNIDFFTAGAPFVNTTFTNTALATTLTAGTTAAPATISSLSTAFGAKNFTFKISDDDGVPAVDNARTRFTQLVISAGPGNTVPDWSQVIQEAELRTVTETTTLLVSGASIGVSTITFATSTADNAEGEVDDNEVKEYELRIRLKNPMTGTAPQNVDGQVFVFQATAAGFTLLNAPSHSSQFGATESENSGSGTTVDVVATRFSFTAGGSVQPPATAFVLTNLTVSPIARAVDINGNTDKGYNGAVTITNTGALPMTSASLPIASGVISFPAGFQYTDDGVFAAGNGTLTVSDGTIINGTSTSVTVSYSNTSTITAGATGEPVTISSLTTLSPGTQVFDFTINEDFGAAGDGSPTRISDIVITQGTGNDIATWTQAIPVNGAVLSDGVNTIVGTVGATSITFSGINVATLGFISDGGSKTYRLNVWLNSSMGGTLPTTVDNLNLVFEVLQANVTTTNQSSTIAPAENENSGSTNNAVAVIATKMDFTTNPAATLLPNKAINLQLPIPIVEARDANNNRDLDYNSTTIVVTNAGSIPMSNAPASNSMSAGLLTFPGTFQYNNVGNGTLTIATSTLNAAAGTPTSAVSTAVSVQAGSATTLSAGGSGSPTIASTVNTVGAAVPVFNFTVNDDPGGTPPAQDDGNPTLITQLKFTQIAPNTITDWTQAIAGAVLTDGTFSTPASGTVTINPTDITVSGISPVILQAGTITSSTGSATVTGVGTAFAAGLIGKVLYDGAGTTRIGTVTAVGSATSLTLSGNAAVTLAGSTFSTADLGLVTDNGTKTYTLRIYLKSALGGTLPITIDGLAFGFEMLTSGVTTSLNGTAVLPAQAQNSGANDVVTVTATKLTFVQLDGSDNFAFPANPWPANADINSPFSPRLGMEARDVNNNRDLGFTGTITAFTVNNSLGTSNNPSGAFTAGTLKFPSLVPASSFFYTSGDNQDGALTVTAGGVTSTSPPINVRSSQDAYVYFDDTGYTPLINSATQQAASLPATADATIATLAKLVLSDGGAANFELTGLNSAISDGDGAFTRISQISFAVTNSQDLRTLALYNNAGTKISSDVAAGPTVNFTGLNIQAPDNGTIDFTVRTTFASTITADHDLVQLTITGVTQSAGSLLYQGPTPPNAAYKGGVLNGDQTLPTANKIDVVATKLVFTQNPPAFAGILEPVPFSGTPATTVVARDANNNLDVDFDFATNSTVGSLTSVANLTSTSFPFAAGVLDLGTYRYSGVGDGTLTVNVSSGLPPVVVGFPPVIAAPTAAVSSHVDVIHVATSIATGGIIGSTNLAGGAVNKVIFGITFSAAYQAAGEPDLSSFRINFGNLGSVHLDQIFANPRIFENTSATFGGPNISSFGGTVTFDNTTFRDLIVNFPTPRPLSTAKSYFLMVDILSTASGSTPSVTPNVIDDPYPAVTGTNIVTTKGSATSNVSGQTYNFSAIFPPTLTSSYPATGQLNVSRNQPTISLTFSVPVWSLNSAGIGLYDGATDAFIQNLPLASSGAGSGEYAGGVVGNLGNPLVFQLPGAGVLQDNHVYYIKIDAGVFNGAAAVNNKGIMDQAGNLFAGISYSGTLYFKTANPNAPNLLSTPVSASNPTVLNPSTTGGVISAVFDQPGKAFFLVLPNGTATPTPAQIQSGAHPSQVASGSFDIDQIKPASQFGVITPSSGTFTAGSTYDVWMSAVGYSENNGVLTQIPAIAPAHYGNIGNVPKTGTITTTTTSNVVTGSGTLFTTELVPGRSLFDGAVLIGTIATITSPTSLTLAANAPVDLTNQPYTASGFEVGATGPTLTFIAAATSASVTLNQPSLDICTDAYSTLNLPIVITESSSKADFSSGSTQNFNLVLPAGFSFDASLTNGRPTYGKLTLTGADFTIPPLQSGTITTSLLSPNVVGVGTLFTSQFNIGDVVYNSTGTTLIGTVASITSNTNMTLTSNAAVAVAAATYRGPYHPGNPQLGFVGSSILTVSYVNNGNATIDKIIISDLRVTSPSGASGPITRFGGNALLAAIPDLSSVATISSSDAQGITFSNSYSLLKFGNGSVTTIPDEFQDPVLLTQPNAVQLFPVAPFGDYGPTSFSGPGVNINILNLTAVTLNTPFNITVDHKDNNGCPSTSFEQYTVYDHTRAIADLSPEYCSTNTNFTITNPTALATTGVATHLVTFDRLQSYYLENLVSRVPLNAQPFGTPPAPGLLPQIIYGPGWDNVIQNFMITKLFNQVYPGPPSTPYPIFPATGGFNPANNPIPGTAPFTGPNAPKTYFNYMIDEATVLNAKTLDGTIPRNPYDYFIQQSPQGNAYYKGGSLGIVEFEGTYQSIANANIQIPLIQNVEFFVPAVPIIETSRPSFLDVADTNNPPGPPGDSNQGTPVFCELGGSITLNGYPAASPGSSVGTFRLFNLGGTAIYDPSLPANTVISAVNNGGFTELTLSAPIIINVNDFIELAGATPVGLNAPNASHKVLSKISGSKFTVNIPFSGGNNFTAATVTVGGFKDNGNGIASIDPTMLKNGYLDIVVEYEYHDLASPCTSKSKQIIRISPNPVASFSFQSLSGSSYIVSPAAKCEDEPITFTSGATSADPKDGTIRTYTWDFGDPSSLTNQVSKPVPVEVHTYDNPSTIPYLVKHNVVSYWGCPSVTIASPSTIQDVTQNLDVGQKPVVKFSLSGLAKGDVFKFTAHDATGNTTVSANDAIKQLKWDFGEGAPGTNVNVRDVADGLTTNAQFTADVVTYTYTQIGPQLVDLEVQTNLGCQNRLSLDGTYRNIVVLDRKVLVTSSDVYEEDFNATDGNWQKWGAALTIPDMVAAIPTATWGRGLPANPFDPSYNLTYSQIAGAGLMKTNPTGNYNADEKSALYSPSFDLSPLQRPMISFSSIVQTAVSDGVVLQFSTDTLNVADPDKVWQTLGQIGDGEDWFNINAIAGKPGDQSQDDFGWSGADRTSWIFPKHTLDVVNGSTHVVFRYAMGSVSGGSSGFWLDNVRIGDRTRTILLESFANTANQSKTGTWESEKAQADSVASFQDGAVGTEVIKLNYHVSFPGKDPMNEDNPGDPSSRALFYNITTTPRSVLDGEKDQADRLFSVWGQSLYDVRSLQLAKADITINPSVVADSLIINVDVKSTVLTGIGTNTLVHVVVLEKGVTLPSAKQSIVKSGETSFEYVVKKMLPSAAGTPFGAVLPYNSTRSFGPFVWKPELSRLYDNPNDLVVAVFLQESVPPYEVHQVELFEPINDPSIVTGLEPLASDKVLVYPIPANREMTVQLPGQVAKRADLQLIDQTGRPALKSSIPEGSDRATLNVSELSGGVYILTIDMGQGVLTRKKVMVVHQD